MPLNNTMLLSFFFDTEDPFENSQENPSEFLSKDPEESIKDNTRQDDYIEVIHLQGQFIRAQLSCIV